MFFCVQCFNNIFKTWFLINTYSKLHLLCETFSYYSLLYFSKIVFNTRLYTYHLPNHSHCCAYWIKFEICMPLCYLYFKFKALNNMTYEQFLKPAKLQTNKLIKLVLFCTHIAMCIYLYEIIWMTLVHVPFWTFSLKKPIWNIFCLVHY